MIPRASPRDHTAEPEIAYVVAGGIYHLVDDKQCDVGVVVTTQTKWIRVWVISVLTRRRCYELRY